jgi:hypothetical protein
MVPGLLAKGVVHLLDKEEQVREEAWTDAWEVTLNQAQDIVSDLQMERQIHNIVDAIAMIKIKETHDVE